MEEALAVPVHEHLLAQVVVAECRHSWARVLIAIAACPASFGQDPLQRNAQVSILASTRRAVFSCQVLLTHMGRLQRVHAIAQRVYLVAKLLAIGVDVCGRGRRHAEPQEMKRRLVVLVGQVAPDTGAEEVSTGKRAGRYRRSQLERVCSGRSRSDCCVLPSLVVRGTIDGGILRTRRAMVSLPVLLHGTRSHKLSTGAGHEPFVCDTALRRDQPPSLTLIDSSGCRLHAFGFPALVQ